MNGRMIYQCQNLQEIIVNDLIDSQSWTENSKSLNKLLNVNYFLIVDVQQSFSNKPGWVLIRIYNVNNCEILEINENFKQDEYGDKTNIRLCQ